MDNYYCQTAKDNFTDAMKEFDRIKSKKKHLEATLEAAGQKEQKHENERNDKIIDLRSKEKEIQRARDEGRSDEDLEKERNRIVGELRDIEEKLRYMREFISEKRADHYATSGELSKQRDKLINLGSTVRTDCSGHAGTIDIDLSIPDLD